MLEKYLEKNCHFFLHGERENFDKEDKGALLRRWKEWLARACVGVCVRACMCVCTAEWGRNKNYWVLALWKTSLDAHLPAACLIKRMYNKWRMSKCKILHAAMITFVENADCLMRNWLLLRVRENQNDLQPPTYTNTIIIIKKINNTHLSYLSAVSRSKVISTIVFKRRVSE